MADKQVIYYGITTALSEKIDNYIEQTGEPVAICVKDEELKKYKGKKLFDKYDILSLDEALKKYPEADFWVVYSSPGPTTRRLLKRLKVEKIHFLEADLEYRKGCRFLGHFISYRKDNFSPCCVARHSPVAKTQGSIPERLAHWKEYTTKLVDDIRNDRPNACAKCPHLKYGFYKKSIKLDTVSFGTNQPGDVCNYKCVYCFSEDQLKRLKEDEDGFTTYEIIKQLSEMPEFDTPDFKIQLSNGEFCANKHCNEIFDILLKSQWKVVFVTNMSIYNEKFAEFLKTGRAVHVLVSLDAGTPATYKKVKGLDCLDKVLANMKKYSFDKTKLCIKYIFLEGINDNEEDVDAFYEIVRDYKCKTKDLVFSSDLFKPFTKKMRNLAMRVIQKAKNDGVIISANSSYLCNKDAEFIKKAYAEAFKMKHNGNCIVYNPDAKAKISGTGNLELNSDYVPFSKDECKIILGENSNLVVNGDFKINSSCVTELKEDAVLVLGSGVIQRGTRIVCARNIKIGENVTIGSNCYISDTDGYQLTDKKHRKLNPIAPVQICDNAWIGHGSVIARGVTIGRGAIVAPNSVVLSDVPKNSIVQGNPARVVKKKILREGCNDSTSTHSKK